MREPENFTYKDFYDMRYPKPKKTEKALKEAILKNIDGLQQQRDFYSLSEVLRLTDQLLDEENEERGYSLMLIVRLLNNTTDAQVRETFGFINSYLNSGARHKGA